MTLEGITFGSPIVLAVVFATVIILTTQLTKSSKSSTAPPMVSSWIPYLGSSYALNKDPDAFMAAAKKKYPGGVFGVKIAGRTCYYITDVKLINIIHKQSKEFFMGSIGFYLSKWAFEVTDKALYDTNSYPVIKAHLHQFFAPKNIGPFVESFASHLHSVLHENKEIEPLTSTAPVTSPLLEFMYRIAYRATGRMLFGTTWDTSDEAIELYNAFDCGIYKIAGGYPPSMMRSFRKGRKGIKQIIHKYLSEPHQPCQWVSGRYEIGKNGGWGQDDQVTFLLGSIWPVLANTPFAAYWVIALSLQHTDGVRPLIDELDAAGSRFMSQNPELKGLYTDHLAVFFQSNPSTPLLASTISETLRYTSDSYSMREVMVDQVNVGGYTIKKGDTIACVTRSAHMDRKEFGDDAEQWVPRRFMRHSPVEEDRKGSSGTESQFNWMPFGGGGAMCSGRYFAQYHMKITITALLKTFRFDVDHAKSSVKLGSSNRGFGIRRPEGDLIVNITRL